jgi:hypothetical protein
LVLGPPAFLLSRLLFCPAVLFFNSGENPSQELLALRRLRDGPVQTIDVVLPIKSGLIGRGRLLRLSRDHLYQGNYNKDIMGLN